MKRIRVTLPVIALAVIALKLDTAHGDTPCGTFLAKWGSLGSGDGEFNYPVSIAVDGSGNVLVADDLNYRIQKFTNTGTFLTEWGSLGSGDGQFDVPLAVAVDGSGNVFVADRNNNRIQKFTNTGTFLLAFGWGVKDGLAAPETCTSACQAGLRGSGDGQFKFVLPLGGVAVDGSGNVFVADDGNLRIQKFTNTGTFLTKWGSGGSGDGQFSAPLGVAVDGSGNVFVADTYQNHRIQKFTNTGTFLAKWGSPGSGDGQFEAYVFGVAVDGSGNVIAADTSNDRIQKFTNTGTFLAKWGSLGSGDGQFDEPVGVAVDGSGNVFVADQNNNRIQEFACTSPSLGVYPNSGGNTGSVTVTVFGNGFASGATLKLSQTGLADTVATNVDVAAGGGSLTGTFDLTGQQAGPRDMSVINPDGSRATLPGGFTVLQGGAPNLWVNILGNSFVRTGLPATYWIAYGNSGTVDAFGVPLFIAGIPEGSTVRLGFPISPPSFGATGLVTFDFSCRTSSTQVRR